MLTNAIFPNADDSMRQYVVLLIANILLSGERLPQQCSKVCSILDLLGFSKYDDILGGDNRYKTR